MTDWHIFGTIADYTVWRRDDAYNISRGEIPSGIGGYYNVGAMLRLKNLSERDLRVATGRDAHVRAFPAESFSGGRYWHAAVQIGDDWRSVDSGFGARFYNSPEEARRDALDHLDTAFGNRFAIPPEPVEPILRYCS